MLFLIIVCVGNIDANLRVTLSFLSNSGRQFNCKLEGYFKYCL